jgi:hypothetical protein
MHPIMLGTYEPQHTKPNIKAASETISIDLEKPIDLSQMDVEECSVLPIETFSGMKFHRTTKLRCYLPNGEELLIVVTLISNSRPQKEKLKD